MDLKVTDSRGNSVFSNPITINVVSHHHAMAVTIETNYTHTLTSETSKVYANVSGVTPPYRYSWYIDGRLEAGINSSVFVFSASRPGSYTILLAAFDSPGANKTSSAVMTQVTGSKNSTGRYKGGGGIHSIFIPLLAGVMAASVILAPFSLWYLL